MSKGLRNTGLTVIFVAISTILLHSFVPHDHHNDPAYSNFEKNCNDSGQNKESNEKATHCHAFNEPIIDKISHNSNFFSGLFTIRKTDYEITIPLIQIVIPENNEKNNPINIFLFKLLRAPPANLFKV